MRQLITRLDDELHARVKARAETEGVSMNQLVARLLEAAVGDENPRVAVRRRAVAAGRLVVPAPPRRVPSRDEALAAGRGTGRSVSTELADERQQR